ncbi:HDIG domain-containing protein [Paenibacillus antri]|uniref:HDIG domain-containing protein n=1 Tax=Paenibacillus antri TaxID=2582848 RepID=A0A5R9G7J0_9BACL|nr:HDIG domain-containing metalloprotein [Paenibacillus antri]TLS50346.1 HDIG domain-containing protein [Paenibacillus antri]
MTQKEVRIRGKHRYKIGGWRYSMGVRAALLLSFALLFYFSLAENVIPPTYDVQPNTVSKETIYANARIEDELATEAARADAVRRVQPVSTIVSMRNTDLVERLFDEIARINADEGLTTDEKVSVYRNKLPDLFRQTYETTLTKWLNADTYSATLIDEIRLRLNEQQYRLQEEDLFKLPKLTQEQLLEMEPVVIDIVNRLMSDPTGDAESVRMQVPEWVNASTLTSNVTRGLAQEIIRFALTPNRFYDEDATVRAREAAERDTETIYIEKGDAIVRAGQTITEELYQKLEQMNLIQNGNNNVLPRLGLAALCLLFLGALHAFVRHSRLAIRNDNRLLLMLFIIYVINLAAMKIVSIAQGLDTSLAYLAPVALGTMLIAVLLDDQLATISTVLFSIVASIVFHAEQDALFDFRYGFVALVVGYVAIFAIRRVSQRASILRAGISVSVFSALSVALLAVIENPEMTNYQDVLLAVAYAFTGGVVTAVFVLGLMPFFEATFGILSPLKLVELSNPNHPLLRKLLTEAPGTYHHSVMVGNLSEAAAEAIGANGLLCRVGSFYHDIGKTRRPSYFIENQMNRENPHDTLEPSVSKAIIVAHAKDGVDMLSEAKIPKPIRDIAEQHHGTTLLKYFYYKAVKQREEYAARIAESAGDAEAAAAVEPIPETDYRYPGPKAQTKEAAIVGIADCVEAAVRSLRNPTVEHVDSMVRKIIKDRLDDQQFHECDMTLKELDIVAKSMKETLLGVFHSRIEYPGDAPQNGAAKTKGEA